MDKCDNALIQIYKASKHLQKISSIACKKLHINHVQLMIIAMSSSKPMNVSKLSEQLGISKSAVSQAIVGLEAKKLITKEESENNKKIFFIKPTTYAEEQCIEIFNFHKLNFDNIVKKVGLNNFETFFNLLEKINYTIENMEDNYVKIN